MTKVDRFLAQFKLMDALGYLIPGLILLSALGPVLPSSVYGWVGIWDGASPARFVMWLVACYVIGYLLSTSSEQVLVTLGTSRLFKILLTMLNVHVLRTDISCSNTESQHKLHPLAINWAGRCATCETNYIKDIDRELGVAFQAELEHNLGRKLNKLSTSSKLQLGKAVIRGTPIGDDVERIHTFRRMTSGLIVVFPLIAIVHACASSGSGYVAVVCALLLLPCFIVSINDHRDANEAIAASGLIELFKNRRPDHQPGETTDSDGKEQP